MIKLTKILVILTGVLFLVIIFELGFYFFYLPRQKKPSSVKLKSDTFKNARDNGVAYLTALIKDFPFQDLQFYSNLFTLHYKDNVYKSLILTDEIKGEIVNIIDKPGQFNPIRKYQIRFDIKVKNYDGTIKIYYPKEEIPLVKLASKEGQMLQLTDFKIGDTILVRETYDLKTFKLIKAEIIRL